MRPKWGLSWIVAEVERIPLSSFMSSSLHFWLDHVALTFGDSSLKARHGKEARGFPGMPPMKHFFLGVLTSCSGCRVSNVMPSLSCTSWRNPSGCLRGVFWLESKRFFIWRISNFSCRNLPGLSSGSAEGGVNNRIASV